MKPNKILDEAKKYLFYVSDALGSAAQSYSISIKDRDAIAQYADQILAAAKGLEELNVNIEAKEKEHKHVQIVAALEARYDAYKSIAVRAKKNLEIVQSQLKDVTKNGSMQQIEEVKARAEYYAKQNKVAQQNEWVAQRDLDGNSL